MYRFRQPRKRSSKGDDNSITFQLRMSNLFDLLPKVTTLKGIKVWTQHRSKGKPLNQTNGHFDVDYSYQSQLLGTSHGKVKLHPARSLALNLTKSIHNFIDQKS